MQTPTAPATFSINFDYRCPFARNANEHVLAALAAGAPYEVTFLGFSLNQAHVDEGEPAIWDQPSRRPDSLALAAGIVVRERFPRQFPDVHLELFRARHDEGGDLRSDTVVREALARGGVDPDAVYEELDAGWAFETLKDEHETSVARHSVFGVPTFILGGHAAFVRLMTRPGADGELALRTVGRVVDLLGSAPELNEFKHTTLDR